MLAYARISLIKIFFRRRFMKRISRIISCLVFSSVLLAGAALLSSCDTDDDDDSSSSSSSTSSSTTSTTKATVGVPVITSVTQASGSNKITISWTCENATSDTRFEISYGTSSSSVKTSLNSYVKGTSYTTLFAKASGTYYFTVKVASLSSTTPSAAKSLVFTRRIVAPSTVTATNGYTLFGSTGDGVSVEWEDTGVPYYDVYYGTTNNSSSATYWKTVDIAKASAMAAGLSGNISLTSGTTYYFWVKAADSNYSASGRTTSGFSPVASVTYTASSN